MTQIIVTITTATPLDPKFIEALKGELEDIVRDGAAHGVTVQTEVQP